MSQNISNLTLAEILSELDELDYATFGRVSAYILNQRNLLYQVIDQNVDLQRQVSELQPTRRKRRTLNEPQSFHQGRPCVRCNKLADHFNKKGIKISMPRDHPYGSCPLYCNLCSNKFNCENPELHLAYSCDRCSPAYSNHPTEHCARR